MKNRWDDDTAQRYGADSGLGLRVYSSRLIGEDGELVLHGGGNTSVKGELENTFGETERVLFVKGSGWDLRTIEAGGFAPVKLDYLLRLGALPELSDSEMMRQLRLALLNPGAPTPSVEAILHALIPYKYVDHSHADAVVTISNTPGGEKLLREIYGDEVLILPYIMPGFILARQVAAATRNLDWSAIKGIILLHHGIFTFHDEARTSYDNMIELVSGAENFLRHRTGEGTIATAGYMPGAEEGIWLSRLRHAAGVLFGAPVLARLDCSAQAAGFAGLSGAGELAGRGPLTPDHSIHAKAFAAVLGEEPTADLTRFEKKYRDYFAAHAGEQHRCLDCMPRYALWQNRGMVYFAGNRKRLGIVQDITRHTVKAIQLGEVLGGWQPLPQSDLFEVEYWELEQAKLKSGNSRAEFEGKVAVVTGAASGIGRACVELLAERGAVVIALDIAGGFAGDFTSDGVLPLACDVTDGAAVAAALLRGVCHFGGIDLLVSNAGNFPAGQTVESMQDTDWDRSLELNLSSHMRVLRACLPYLKQGFNPAVVIVASKNVPAPGRAAAAYSAAKAGLTQLARVAALELGSAGIRVNALHPNAVYDTAIWTDQLLQQRAAHYGMTVAEYKTANVLRAEVTAADVARAVVALAGEGLAKTTGSQIPVDGGNERVI